MSKLFEQIANDLREQILSGDLLPGTTLPSAAELHERYGGARATVRRAVEVLEAERLVTTGQGRRATVRKRPKIDLQQTGPAYRAGRASGRSNFNATAAEGRRTQRIREVTHVPAAEDIALRLGVESGADVVLRRLVFLEGDEPVQLVDSYYDPALVAGTPITQARLIRGGAHRVIGDPEGPIRRRIVQFIEDVTARAPYAHEVEALGIPAGVPVMRTLRTAYDAAGHAVEVLDSRLPGDRHSLQYVTNV